MRPFDIVLFGATGFTGKLTAAHLARHAGGLRCAIAGRNRSKLEQLQQQLGDVAIIQADTDDAASLARMAEQARVVVSTVGPYARFGEAVVAACVEQGAHYLDITGEPDFVSAVRKRHDAAARERKLVLVNCCGFDSMPADLGALYTVSQLPKGHRYTVEAFVQSHGRFSGGTWRSAINAFAQPAKRQPSKSGDRSRKARSAKKPRSNGRINRRIHYRSEIAGWAVPMPVIDPLIVKRSSRALPDIYGEGFAYGQFLRLGSVSKVAALLGGVAAVYGLAQLPPTRRWLLAKHQSGSGPSEETRIESFFRVTFVGNSDAGHRVMTRVSGGDPGYDETSKMLAETALLLARTPAEELAVCGVVTPAHAFGHALIERLSDVGICFETL